MMEKTCIDCNDVKQINAFYSSKHDVCRSCTIMKKRALEKELNPITKRKCSKCNEVKDISEYYKDHNSVKSMCKVCYCNKYCNQANMNLKTSIDIIKAFVAEKSDTCNIKQIRKQIDELEDQLMELALA